MPDEERYTKRRQADNRLPDRVISPKQARLSHTAQRKEESCSSSRSPSPAEKKGRREEGIKNIEPEKKRECSASSSVSSETESSPSPDKHKRSLRSKPQSKVRPSKEPSRSSKREIARDSAKRGSRHSKHKHRQRRTRSLSESERSEHTSDNFSEIEARRKVASRARKLKVSKKRHRDKHSSSLRGKLKRASKRTCTERSVVAKRKQRTRSLELSEDSENTEGGEVRDRTKKRHRHVSPVVVKKSRHKRTPPPPPDSNSESSDSESSSSDSNSDWSGDAREKKKDKSSGKSRKNPRVESSDVSSETEDSLDGERRRSSLEKHLREKVIQAMSKKKLKKNKN